MQHTHQAGHTTQVNKERTFVHLAACSVPALHDLVSCSASCFCYAKRLSHLTALTIAVHDCSSLVLLLL